MIFSDVPEFVGKVRTDRRCGSEFPLPDGKPSECDPKSDNACCSKWGYCGPDADHCECEECVDYRRDDISGTCSNTSLISRFRVIFLFLAIPLIRFLSFLCNSFDKLWRKSKI